MCWVAMTAIGLVATGFVENSNIQQGDPRRLINAIDYKGNICGVESEVHSKKLAYYMLDQTGMQIEPW